MSTEKKQPPHFQDATVISDRVPAMTPDMAVPVPLRQQDIGKALLGQELGHFRLDDFIGGGGMGTVFRAVDLQLERTVAVKVLTHRYAHDSETVRRFRIEAQSAARLNHENIASVYFVGQDKGWNFIVFEHIEGENIRDLVSRVGPLPLAQTVNIIVQVAAALSHASHRDVVHRDIKPSNVLLTPEGRAKLVDMGLARLRQVESDEEDLTVSGVTMGTFDYISPEQGRDPRDADVRSDLYSLGCTFYYMLTGQPPYPDGTVLQKLLSHTSDPPVDPRAIRSETPDGIAEIVLRLLAKRPADRFQTPADLITALRVVAEVEGLPLVAAPLDWSPPIVATPPKWIRMSPWLVPISLFVALLIGLQLFSLTREKQDVLPEFQQPRGNSLPSSAPHNGEKAVDLES